MLTSLTVVIISLCIGVSKHHLVHLKYNCYDKQTSKQAGYGSNQKTGSWTSVFYTFKAHRNNLI